MTTEIPGQLSGGTPGAPAPAAPGSATPPAAPATPPAAPATPPAVPAPVALPWTGAQGIWNVGDKPWWDGITEAPVKELMDAKKYANPHELAMAYYNANKLVSGAADAVIVPAPDAPQEKWDEYYTKRGRPATADEYKFQHKEGITVDPTMEAFGKKLFHSVGLNASEAQKAVSQWNDFIGEYNAAIVKQQQATNDAEIVALEQRWGPELKANLAAGNEVLKVVGIPEALVARVEDKIGSAAVIELLAMIGKATPGGSFKGGGNGGGEPTGEAAKAEITKLQTDPSYFDKNHPQHKETVDKVARLWARV